ncbi:MAG: flagellar hook-length control protein FliK [Pseudomonadota bacterium]|nr:flagellar hook-length control protein FliK [Pseudomonadota bacterium]
MQFFPHIGSSGFPPPPSTPGLLADRQPDENFASLLSSQLDRQDMSAAEKDAPASTLDEADTGAEASSPEAPSSFSGPEPDHGVSEETSFRREFSHEDASRPEIEKGAQKEAPEKSAAPEEMAPGKEAPHEDASGTAGRHGMDGIVQELADVIREMEALLKPAGKKMAETSDGPREKDGALRELSRSSRELLEFVRKETSGIGSGMKKSTLAEANAAGVGELLDALREKLEVMLQNAGDGASGGAVRDKAESRALRKDARQIASELFGDGRDIRLSMRDREALQEILARMENMKERLARMESAEPARIIRPVGRRDSGIDANAPEPGKVARGPHPSVSVRKKMDPAAPEPSSAVETTRASAMASPDAARTARVGTRNESAESREVSAGQHVEREARSTGTSVVPEPSSGSGQERPGGNFFREPGQSGQPGKEGPNPVEGTRINVSPRSLEGGERLTVKNPDMEGIFIPQAPAAVRPEAASATAMKARGAEVLRQVEAGAFRDLGQGNKQLVIRLDPPDLGQVSVVLQVRGKEVQAVLRTGNQETSQVLADQLGQLRNQLESQGLRVTRLEVQTQLADSQTGSQWQGAEQHNRYQENRELAMTAQRLRTLGRAEPVLARDMQNLPHKENISSGGVDVFA